MLKPVGQNSLAFSKQVLHEMPYPGHRICEADFPSAAVTFLGEMGGGVMHPDRNIVINAIKEENLFKLILIINSILNWVSYPVVFKRSIGKDPVYGKTFSYLCRI